MPTEALVKHPFVSGKADGPDSTLVKPSNWNDRHVASGGAAGLAPVWDNDQTGKIAWGRFDHLNYVYNADFKTWGDGTSTAPTGWRVVGAGAVVGQDSVGFKYSPYSASLQRNGTDCYLAQDAALIWPDFLHIAKSRKITIGAWVKCSASGVARLVLADGIGTSTSAYHTGSGSYEFLKIERTINASATIIEVRLQVDTGNATAYFDGVILAFCGQPELDDFYPGIYKPVVSTLYFGSVTSQAQNTTRFYGPFGLDTAENQVSMPAPTRGIVKNLRAVLSAAPAGSNTAVFTVRLNETTNTTLVLTVTGPDSVGSNLTDSFAVVGGDKISTRVVLSATSGSIAIRGTMELEHTPDAY